MFDRKIFVKNFGILEGGSEYGGSQKLPYFRSGNRKCSAHFSGFEHKIINETEISFLEGQKI